MTAGPSGFSSKPTPKARFQILNEKYGSPLPILLPNSTAGNKGKSKSIFSSYTSAITTEVAVPKCIGVFDPITRSVWVTDRADIDILFRRGFFGKGTLSRSEPSWRERRVDLVKGGSCMSSLKRID
jgi:tRNA-splicing endonuclease subunit Sen2